MTASHTPKKPQPPPGNTAVRLMVPRWKVPLSLCLPAFLYRNLIFKILSLPLQNNDFITEQQVQVQTSWRNKHPEMLNDGRRAQRLVCNFWIKKMIYLHSCRSARLQQWSGSVVLFCMLTADWSWRRNGLYFMNVTLQRGDREPEPEPVSAEVWVQSEAELNSETQTPSVLVAAR